jgi:hypothetical protein
LRAVFSARFSFSLSSLFALFVFSLRVWDGELIKGINFLFFVEFFFRLWYNDTNQTKGIIVLTKNK